MSDPVPAIDRRAVARAISSVEDRSGDCAALLARAYRLARWPDVIGVTGPPGAGKSTLVDGLAAYWAEGGGRIAVLAIDPSSPYSGGAVLGDRIRRTRSAACENVYFRSLSSRGHVGGLSEAVADLVAVLGAFDFDRVLIETVGAGQSDCEIHETADCTLVVTVPGLGDAIQASKAGLMEIGDLFVVNKADRAGAGEAARDIEQILSTAYSRRWEHESLTPGRQALERRHGAADGQPAWIPPVLRVVATENREVTTLAARVDEFLAWSTRTGRRAHRIRGRVCAQLMRTLSARLMERYTCDAAPLGPWIERIVQGHASPLEAARAILGLHDEETS